MKINCFQCTHFYVTWDPVNPRGCRAHGMKCKPVPSVIVKRASGVDCMYFQPKQKGEQS